LPVFPILKIFDRFARSMASFDICNGFYLNWRRIS